VENDKRTYAEKQLSFKEAKIAEDIAFDHFTLSDYKVKRSGIEAVEEALFNTDLRTVLALDLKERLDKLPDLFIVYDNQGYFVEIKWYSRVFLSNENKQCTDCGHLKSGHIYRDSDYTCTLKTCLDCSYKDYNTVIPPLFYLIADYAQLKYSAESPIKRFKERTLLLRTDKSGWWSADSLPTRTLFPVISDRKFASVFKTHIKPQLKALKAMNKQKTS